MVRGVTALGIGVAVLLLVCLLAAWKYKAIGARAHRFIPARAVHAVRGIGQSLAPLRSIRRGGGALALALGKMVAEALAMLCVQRAFGIQLPFSSVVLVLA